MVNNIRKRVEKNSRTRKGSQDFWTDSYTIYIKK